MRKKSLIILSILCAIFILIMPISIGFNYYFFVQPFGFNKSTNILYVGGSGPNNYTKIQYAIDNASDGDFIFVFNGIYYENIILNKLSLHLIGEDKENTIIDGEDNNKNVIYLQKNNLSITGFTIQNSGNFQESIAGIKLKTNNNSIFDNIIIKNKIGLIVDGNYNKIFDNLIVSNNYEGIQIVSNENIIINNFIEGKKVGEFSNAGVSVIGSSNLIKGNTITNHNSGITILGACNIIKNNNISNNDDGIYLTENDNTIMSNVILNNKCGIQCLGCGNNIISKNNLINNVNTELITSILFIILGQWNNDWNNNYYSDYNGGIVYIIRGYGFISFIIPFPWFDIDWNPASEPFDI